MHGSCNPSRLDGGDCDLFVANPVEECPRRARCRTGQYATRRWRIGGVEDTEVTGAGHKRMPPRDGRHVPPISGCDLLPLRDIVEDAAQVGADTGEGDDIALGNLQLLPQTRGPLQRELDLEGRRTTTPGTFAALNPSGVYCGYFCVKTKYLKSHGSGISESRAHRDVAHRRPIDPELL